MSKNIARLALIEIEEKEEKIKLIDNVIVASSQMIHFLQETLDEIKTSVTTKGFKSIYDEIEFFKVTKPLILGKLIYYNKLYRLETLMPVYEGKLYHKYYRVAYDELKNELKMISNTDFYRYYRSGRTDLDHVYFQRGQINIENGLNSYVFEIDPKFSTYYDFKVARVIAYELFHSYLSAKIVPESIPINGTSEDVFWTGTHAELIELIYAWHSVGSISYGKASIRAVSKAVQLAFRIKLSDEHHTFYRMKSRSGQRAIYLQKLIRGIEELMDKDLD